MTSFKLAFEKRGTPEWKRARSKVYGGLLTLGLTLTTLAVLKAGTASVSAATESSAVRRELRAANATCSRRPQCELDFEGDGMVRSLLRCPGLLRHTGVAGAWRASTPAGAAAAAGPDRRCCC